MSDAELLLPFRLWTQASEYWVDAVQRGILFWDVLRQRGNSDFEHRERGQPPVLEFEYETVIDGRTLERPCNYALLRITPDKDAPVDPTKRAYVVVDPRAGHGPGIGGSKLDSQVGMARRAGHPVYFVTFFPDPMPGQRLRDVAAAEAKFIEEVARRHPKAIGKPCVVGNCQAGWAVAALAAMRPDLMGPILLNGAPLSYWSGAGNTNPMRYTGGLLGGKWIESLACDLGDGLFDGANLVANFENLDLANTYWKKYYNLYSKIDTEPKRFLGFEQWWGGYFTMNREEIDAIVSELFIGNKLARGEVRPEGSAAISLRDIRSPIVIFASFGDNITPPQQALNWIEDVYGDEQAIIDADQTIIYLLHKDIGHLGIFVSGRVATKEHRELVATLDMIDALPAGLYEMIIDEKSDDARFAALEPGQYLVRFESRTMDDIRSLEDTRQDEALFQTVDAVSRLNDQAYQAFVAPIVRATITSDAADTLRRLHPLRLQRELPSDRNPLMRPLAAWASAVRARRMPAGADNPFVAMEHAWSNGVVASLNGMRDLRDAWSELAFQWMYGPYGFGALFPPTPRQAPSAPAAREPSRLPTELFERGDALTAVLRMIAAAVLDAGVFDRRSLLIFRSLRANSRFKDVPAERVRDLFREQARLVRNDRDRALQALATLLTTREERRAALAALAEVAMVAPDEIKLDAPLAKALGEILHVDLKEVVTERHTVAAKKPSTDRPESSPPLRERK